MLSLIAFAANVATLTMPERAAIFVGAGATKRGARWMICKEDLNASARIDQIEDLNGDGRPEAVVGEDGTYCYGAAGTGFTLLTKQANGKWKAIYASEGIPEFLKKRGVGGWPDKMCIRDRINLAPECTKGFNPEPSRSMRQSCSRMNKRKIVPPIWSGAQ